MEHMLPDARSRLLIFSPNLAVDHILELDHLVLGEVQRAVKGSLSAGGKGVNVARAARHIGIAAQVVGLVAGRTGELLRSLLAEEEIFVHSSSVELENRVATILLDRSSRAATVLNEPGPTVGEDQWNQLTNLAEAHLSTDCVLVCVGSLPPGVPDDGYVAPIRAAREQHNPVIVDTSGQALRLSAEAGPTVIKANLSETESALGQLDGFADPDQPGRAVRAAQRLHQISTGAAIVTIKQGAALVNEECSVFINSPHVRVNNEIGAGDSFLAGLADGLLRKDDVVTACRWGVAVAAASVETDQPGQVSQSRATELYARIRPASGDSA